MNMTHRPSPNRTVGRRGHTPDFIVLHTTGASFTSAINTITNPASQVSYHFVISRSGEVVQSVDIENMAWAAGTRTDGGTRDVKHSKVPEVRQRRINANLFTTSIGFGDMPAGNPSPEQMDSAVELIRFIRSEVLRIYGFEIPVARTHIVGHVDITPITRPSCPGRNFPFDELISRIDNNASPPRSVATTQSGPQPSAGSTAALPHAISEQNLQAMQKLGVIQSPEFWNTVSLPHLDKLLADAAAPGKLDSRIDNGVTDVEVALGVITDAGLITGPEQWRKVIMEGSVKFLGQLFINISNRCRDILERIIWAEARGEDLKGQVLVGNVILNRHNSTRFPNGIRGVVFASGTNSKGQFVYQFAPIGDGAYARAVPTPSVKQAVDQILDGVDYSQGATFFRTVRGSEGSWHQNTLTHLFDHGGHRFFK